MMCNNLRGPNAGLALLPKMENVCAVVVAYHPDEDFEARLQTILPQVARLVVVDNTPHPVGLSKALREVWGERLHCITNAENKGIATAINQGLQRAEEGGLTWMLTLDQDSTCYPDMVATLCETYAACPISPAILGSNYFDPGNQKCKISPSGDYLWLEQKTVITSGCLLNVAIARRLGGMRDDYFIDQVDHEFCLRARANGLSVVITRKPTMAHSVGEVGGVRLPLLGVLPNHSPTRKYYIARNTLVTVTRYWSSEPVWCVKRLLKLFLGGMEMVTLETQRSRKAVAFLWGAVDAWYGRMGPLTKCL
jgi:rhamnosyltransferase